MIEWKDYYKLGIQIIDEQHKRLFDIAQEAEEMIELPEYLDKFDDIVALLNELRDYIKYHFQQEEELLLEIKYKQFFSHKVEHNDFIEYIYSFDLEDIDQHQNERGITIVTMLIEWLIEHVLVKDKEWSKVYHQLHS